MAGKWCIEGLREAADAIWKDNAIPEDKEVFLFSNDATISATTTGADLTEITTSGGEKKTLTKANWTAATDADPVVSQYNGSSGVTFTFTGTVTVHGWAVRGVTSGKIYGAENTGSKTYLSGQSVTVPIQIQFDIPA